MPRAARTRPIRGSASTAPKVTPSRRATRTATQVAMALRARALNTTDRQVPCLDGKRRRIDVEKLEREAPHEDQCFLGG